MRGSRAGGVRSTNRPDDAACAAPEVTVELTLAVVAIVGGHVMAVLLAHRLRARHDGGTALRSEAPMVLMMIGYTVLSLWIVAQPIVVEPGRPGAGVGG